MNELLDPMARSPLLEKKYSGTKFYDTLMTGLFSFDRRWNIGDTRWHVQAFSSIDSEYYEEGRSKIHIPGEVRIILTDCLTTPKRGGSLRAWSNGLDFITSGFASAVDIKPDEEKEVQAQKIVSWLNEQARKGSRYRPYGY